MIAYFDTSALIKLIIEEAGSESAKQLWDASASTFGGRLVYPGGRAALASARRGGRLSAAGLRSAKARLAELWDQILVVELSAQVADAAGDLAERYALRGYDAVHLASALTIKDMDRVFVTWDRDLSLAAARAGLPVAPVA